jgi:hypothetical protein
MVKRPKVSEKKPKKRVKFIDEEILSDEAEISEDFDDNFFDNTETPEDKRIRLAKEVIKDIESVAQTKEEVNELLGQTGVIAT